MATSTQNTGFGAQRDPKKEEWAASELITIHNDGLKTTFVRNNQTSYIDLTLSSASMATLISDWAILDELQSKSDHNYMVMAISDKQKQEPGPPPKGFVTDQNEGKVTHQRSCIPCGEAKELRSRILVER